VSRFGWFRCIDGRQTPFELLSVLTLNQTPHAAGAGFVLRGTDQKQKDQIL
jgi:hypothetical protein